MWKCPKCGEAAEDQFDSCWKCAAPKPAAKDADASEHPLDGSGEVAGAAKAIPTGTELEEHPEQSGRSRSLFMGDGFTPVTEQEIRSFIGSNADYYLFTWGFMWGPVLGDRPGGAGFNWAAFFLGPLWLPYRKMYIGAAILYGFIFLSEMAQGVLGAGGSGTWIGLVPGIICGIFGNKWYLSRARTVITQLRSEGFEGEAYLQALAKRGGTNSAAVVAILAVFFMAIVAFTLNGDSSLVSNNQPNAGENRVYYTPTATEQATKKSIRKDIPSAARAEPPSVVSGVGNLPRLRFPRRDPAAKPTQIDLSLFYNVALDENLHWRPQAGNSLAHLPHGLQTFGGVIFDVRGIVQLSSSVLHEWTPSYPQRVDEIPIGQQCQSLHFLHASGIPLTNVMTIGSYAVHYEDGQEQVIPIVYGEGVRDWWVMRDEPQTTKRPTIAWAGTTPAGVRIRLFKTTWQNPRPKVAIRSIDYVSEMTPAGPFLIAITAEP